jgi:hypothetical protein
LKIEQTIDPRSLDALMPPFSFQPLVENAVQHGLHSSPGAVRLQLVVRPTKSWLEMSVRDDGRGIAATKVEQLSSESALGSMRWCYCAGGCKDCSGARFSWRCVARLERVLLCASPSESGSQLT